MMLEVEGKRAYSVPELKDISPELLLPAVGEGGTPEIEPEPSVDPLDPFG